MVDMVTTFLDRKKIESTHSHLCFTGPAAFGCFKLLTATKQKSVAIPSITKKMNTYGKYL